MMSNGLYKNQINQLASAVSIQEQNANQSNSSLQLTAVAIAEGGGTAVAEQNSYQENSNCQKGNSSAQNTNMTCNCKIDVCQNSEAEINQAQVTDQTQYNYQSAVVAVALNEGSEATAKQDNKQSSMNEQKAESSSENGNNTVYSNSTSVEPETNKDGVKPEENIKVSKDIRNTKGKLKKPFKVTLTLNKNGNILEMKADETGEVKLNGIENALQNFEKIKQKAILNNPNNVSDLRIKIVYNNEILEIHSDEQEKIFINGIEVEHMQNNL